MIDSDQRPDSNRHPLTTLSQITVRFKGILKWVGFFSKFSDLWPIYWLGHTSVMSSLPLDVDLRKCETAIDLRIGR